MGSFSSKTTHFWTTADAYLGFGGPVLGRNAAGKDGRERLGGSVLEQIPFLQHCEDDDSDEDDELDGAQHRKQRVKVSAPAPPWRSPVQEEPHTQRASRACWALLKAAPSLPHVPGSCQPCCGLWSLLRHL